MKKTLKVFLLFLVLIAASQDVKSQKDILSSGSGENKTKPILTAEQIAQRYLAGVVLIICDDGKENYSQGSGFFIAPGMLLTNAHVVKGMVRGIVITGKDQKKNLITAIAYFNNENTDLALVVSDQAKAVKTPILPLTQISDLIIGETVYVLSNPEGLIGTISQGIVSSGIRKIKNKELLQITAPISSGSSGGAVMNSHGEVIGIATSTITSGQNLNFAVPATHIRQFLDEFSTLPSPPEYVVSSKFPGSWIAPKSFLGASVNTSPKSVLPPSKKQNPSETTKPSYEETTTWLKDKLIGTIVYSDATTHKINNLDFDECGMTLKVEVKNEKGNGTTSYAPSLNSLKSADARTNKLGDSGVWLKFSKNIVETMTYYAFEEEETPDSKKWNQSTDTIVIFTKDKSNAERVARAFNRLIELCSQNSKEPF